ncbi:MAG: undecaprenyl-phosphate glucose phosphotransferase [Oceanospirillaceae bacterium]
MPDQGNDQNTTSTVNVISARNQNDSSGEKRRLLRKHKSLLLICQVICNCTIVGVGLLVCIFFKMDSVPALYRLLLIITIFLVLVIYPAFNVYKQTSQFYKMAARITLAWFTTIAILIVMGFLTKTSESFSREIIITWFMLVTLVQIPLLRLNYLAVTYYRKNHTKPINSIVIGLGRTARFFSEKIDKNHWLPDKVLGMVNGYETAIPASIITQLKFPMLGEVVDIKGIIKKYNIKRIYVSLPLKHSAKVEKLNEYLLDCQVDVIWVLDISDWKLMNHSVREVAGLPLLSLNESPVNVDRVQIRVKHILDKLIALLMIVILSPVLIIAAIAVKLSSPGPVIYKQSRHGFNGEEITIFKFRSMTEHKDAQVVQAQKGDMRITKVGAFIRRTSIDELPQLFNVLQGGMSLVGPRPHAVAHNDFYSEKINKYMARHRIKPGITGLAQISGCRGETETVEKMADRVCYDMEYINHWSLWGDFKILIKTPISLLGKDIY